MSECKRQDSLTIRRQYIYQVTQDNGRTAYFNSYLGEVLKGIVDDGLPIKGTFAWSMLDNFEWNSGLSSMFEGLFDVCDADPQLDSVFSMSIMIGESRFMAGLFHAHDQPYSTANCKSCAVFCTTS